MRKGTIQALLAKIAEGMITGGAAGFMFGGLPGAGIGALAYALIKAASGAVEWHAQGRSISEEIAQALGISYEDYRELSSSDRSKMIVAQLSKEAKSLSDKLLLAQLITALQEKGIEIEITSIPEYLADLRSVQSEHTSNLTVLAKATKENSDSLAEMKSAFAALSKPKETPGNGISTLTLEEAESMSSQQEKQMSKLNAHIESLKSAKAKVEAEATDKRYSEYLTKEIARAKLEKEASALGINLSQ